MPGYTKRPAASTTLAPGGTGRSRPTASIFEPRMTTVPLGMRAPTTGTTVAFLMTVTRSAVCAERAEAMNSRPTDRRLTD